MNYLAKNNVSDHIQSKRGIRQENASGKNGLTGVVSLRSRMKACALRFLIGLQKLKTAAPNTAQSPIVNLYGEADSHSLRKWYFGCWCVSTAALICCMLR